MSKQNMQTTDQGAVETRCDQEQCGCAPRADGAAPAFSPPIDVTDSGDEFTVVADIPGSTSEQISVMFEKSVLSIHARVEPRADRPGAALRSEYAVGDYRRSLRLGEDIDPQRITGEYADGVLTLHLPKAEAARARKIEIRAV